MAEFVLTAPKAALPTATAHWLPCTIKHDGSARVADFFEACVADGAGGKGPKETHFRGRRLVGKRFDGEQGMAFLVLREGPPEHDAAGDVRRALRVVARAEPLTQWNHDTEPSPFDRLPGVVGHLGVARAVRCQRERAASRLLNAAPTQIHEDGPADAAH